jgi:serine/threonine-protein kinase
MAKNPDDRFASAAEMSAALRARTEAPAGATDAAPTVMVGAATAIFDAPPTAVPPALPLAVPSASPVPAASPVPPSRPTSAGRSRRRRVLALLAVAGLAVALVIAAADGDNQEASPGGTPAVTGPSPAGAGLPPALDDALRRLEKTVR